MENKDKPPWLALELLECRSITSEGTQHGTEDGDVIIEECVEREPTNVGMNT